MRLGLIQRQRARRSEGFEPPRLLFFRADLFAPQQIGFAENADETPLGVDDRQGADVMVDEPLVAACATSSSALPAMTSLTITSLAFIAVPFSRTTRARAPRRREHNEAIVTQIFRSKVNAGAGP